MFASFGVRVHLHGVAGYDAQLAGEGIGQFSKGGQATAIPFDSDQPCSGSQDRAGQAAGAGSDLERGLIRQ